MKKRLRKKKVWRFKPNKCNSIVTVDLTNVTESKHIHVYISNKFEAFEKEDSWLFNDLQNRRLSGRILRAKNYDYFVNIINGKGKVFNMTVWVSDTDKSYYVIR